MLDEIASKIVDKDKEGDWERKKKSDTEWSKASQKHKEESAEFSRDKSCSKKSTLHINCKTIYRSDRILSV